MVFLLDVIPILHESNEISRLLAESEEMDGTTGRSVGENL